MCSSIADFITSQFIFPHNYEQHLTSYVTAIYIHHVLLKPILFLLQIVFVNSQEKLRLDGIISELRLKSVWQGKHINTSFLSLHVG